MLGLDPGIQWVGFPGQANSRPDGAAGMTRSRNIVMPAGYLARYLRYADRMEVFGPDLGMPHTRARGDGLFELRLKAAEGISRVFYCTMVGKKIMVLHQFIKKADKTPAREHETARRRIREVKNVHT